MAALEVVQNINPPYALWLEDDDLSSQVLSGDELPFLKIENGYVYAPLVDGLKAFITDTASTVDWFYGTPEFHEAVDNLLYLNTLMDIALLNSEPNWDHEFLKRFEVPQLDEKYMSFVGFGLGGSFRSAISRPDNYATVASIRKRIYGELPDMFDIDRKLPPLDVPFEQFVETSLLPNFLKLLKENVFVNERIHPDEHDVVFKGVMSQCKFSKPESVVTVRLVRYENLTILEVRLSDVRHNADPKFPDMTIHISNYERDFRVGPQMPGSMNKTLIPLFMYSGAENGYSNLSDGKAITSQQWMVLPNNKYLEMGASYAHPEIIDEPVYPSIYAALHAGLRAIAERSQHLGPYRDNPGRNIPLDVLLSGDWWKAYQNELNILIREKRSEVSVHSRKNGLKADIIKLFTRLLDFDIELFLRMAVPMGIMEVLDPSFILLISDYGRMIFGPSFSLSDPMMVDTAIICFVLQFPSLVGRNNRENYEIDRPEQLGSQFFMRMLDANGRIRNEPITGVLQDLY